MEWGWYKDPNTKAVFLHLLLTANFKEGEYKGVPLKPGQTIIGRKALAEQLGISEQCVRTALNRLKSTNEITIKSTNKFSVVTVENWAMYQSDESESTNESTNTLTNNQPTTNQQLTNNQPHLKNDKKDNKDKNEKNDYYSLNLDERLRISGVIK
jgi:DNA-binding transcriptional regulator YhcF (GntR family)